ncbi:sulfite exporter TauE/SafE family protein [Hydrogenovibrio kuenenii]|uniref:sulfite exporter TauE/SafE family protein n=1 Tax=Hydrogenovibrio kuenenii TaxID=63658 RepID=UPI0004AC74A1|nr:sulfite exporter TauE/SafE family protein [Hydrogenovibrio kuenenii]
MVEYSELFLALVITGAASGILAGLLGVGGGIVIVPVLYFVFQSLGMGSVEAMSLATGTSLATIVPTSISSIRAHNLRGNVDWNLIRQWWLWICLGVILGAALTSKINSALFVMLFALIAGGVSVKMLLNKKQSGQVKLPSPKTQKIIASLLGFLPVMIGIGGGTLGVPTLSKFNFVMHRAVGTASAFGLIIALPGSLIMLFLGTTPVGSPVGTYGFVNFPSFLTIVPLTVLFAPVGVRLAQKLNATALKKVFAVMLFLVSIKMFLQSVGL